MSSDSITYVQNPETARLQGMQSAPRTQPLPQARPVEGNAMLQRQGKAAGGQDLPPDQAQDAANGPVPVEQVESAVSQISDFVQNFQRDLVFSIDKDSERLVVKVVDSETQEVIRQIPSEEMLRIAKNLDAADSFMLREQA
jgi:flagellar protein FlaG